MKRSLFLAIVIYLILFTGLISLRGDLVLLVLPLVLYFFMGIWNSPQKIDLVIQRELSAEHTAPFVDVDVSITITNHGDAVHELYLQDALPPGLEVRVGTPARLLTLSKGETRLWKYTVRGPRGGYAFQNVRARIQDYFSVTRREVELEAKARLMVFPFFNPVRGISIRPRRTRAVTGLVPARLGGAGTEFYGVRNYQQGDPTRWINWRASARHNELYSNEYQQERASDVGIVLDGRGVVNLFKGGQSLFEYSVQAAASLADSFLSQGNRVGLLVYSNFMYWTLPGYGKTQREKILRALAEARIGSGLALSGLDHLPTRLFPAQSQIIIISPLHKDDLRILFQLRAHGYQVLLIVPDPVYFETSLLPKTDSVEIAARILRMERKNLLSKLSLSGVRIIEWNVQVPFEERSRVWGGRFNRATAWGRL